MDYEKILREYIKTCLDGKYERKAGENWAFAAVDFAFYAGLIGQEERNKLFDEYKLLNLRF